jgi:hypothetical protein
MNCVSRSTVRYKSIVLAIPPNKQGLQMWAQVYITTYSREHLDKLTARGQPQNPPPRPCNRTKVQLLSAENIELCYRHTLQSQHINNNFYCKTLPFYLHLHSFYVYTTCFGHGNHNQKYCKANYNRNETDLQKLLYLTILTMQNVSLPATYPILRKINPVQVLLQDTLNFNICHLLLDLHSDLFPLGFPH